jgi:hypothetical protein
VANTFRTSGKRQAIMAKTTVLKIKIGRLRFFGIFLLYSLGQETLAVYCDKTLGKELKINIR